MMIHYSKHSSQNRELQPGTQARYLCQIRLYCNFIAKTPTEFIQEAEDEEDQKIIHL